MGGGGAHSCCVNNANGKQILYRTNSAVKKQTFVVLYTMHTLIFKQIFLDVRAVMNLNYLLNLFTN